MKMSKGQAMRKAKSKSVNRMVLDIERRVCVRRLWRANAGWAMAFVLTELQARVKDVVAADLQEKKYSYHGTIFAYYNTLEECVRAEYIVWVLRCERPKR